jgi:hypothetical protein
MIFQTGRGPNGPLSLLEVKSDDLLPEVMLRREEDHVNGQSHGHILGVMERVLPPSLFLLFLCGPILDFNWLCWENG